MPLKLFGGIQQPVVGGPNWPDSLWVPITQQATGGQFPANWLRDGVSLGLIAADNFPHATVYARWQSARNYCNANGINGPCVQLSYPAHDAGWGAPGSGSQNNYQEFLQGIAPYCPAGTYEIAANETLSTSGGGSSNGGPLQASFTGGSNPSYGTNYDGLINLIKFQRANLPAGVLLGLNEFDVCSWDNVGQNNNTEAYLSEVAVSAYSILAAHGAALDWLGAEGYYGNTQPNHGQSITWHNNLINSVGSRLVTTAGTGAPGTIAFTEWTPMEGTGDFPTQKAAWQAFLAMFAANQYVFGVTGPWQGIRRSELWNSGDWLYDDTNNMGTDPDGVQTSLGHVTPTLVFVQGWVPANVTGAGGTPPATGPFGGTAPNLPVTIVGAAYDTGGQNIGYNFNLNGGQTVAAAYRTDGVQNLKANTDNFNLATVPWVVGYGIGGTSDTTDNWTQYTVNVPVQNVFTFQLRCGSNTGGAFHLSIDGVDTPVVNVAAQGAWDTPGEWVTVPVPGTYTLTQGNHVLKVLINTSNIDVNVLLVTSAGVTSVTGDLGTPVTNSATATVKNSLAQIQGNQLLAFVTTSNSVTSVLNSFIDANGTYTLIKGPVVSGSHTGWLLSFNGIAAKAPSANTGTATFSAVQQSAIVIWVQVTNQLAGASNFDGTGGSNLGNSAAPSVSLTTTFANSGIFTFGGTNDQFNGAGAGFTNIINDIPDGVLADYLTTSAPGSYTDSLVQPVSSTWVMLAVAIKAQGATVNFGGATLLQAQNSGAFSVGPGTFTVAFGGATRAKAQSTGALAISRLLAGPVVAKSQNSGVLTVTVTSVMFVGATRAKAQSSGALTISRKFGGAALLKTKNTGVFNAGVTAPPVFTGAARMKVQGSGALTISRIFGGSTKSF